MLIKLIKKETMKLMRRKTNICDKTIGFMENPYFSGVISWFIDNLNVK